MSSIRSFQHWSCSSLFWTFHYETEGTVSLWRGLAPDEGGAWSGGWSPGGCWTPSRGLAPKHVPVVSKSRWRTAMHVSTVLKLTQLCLASDEWDNHRLTLMCRVSRYSLRRLFNALKPDVNNVGFSIKLETWHAAPKLFAKFNAAHKDARERGHTWVSNTMRLEFSGEGVEPAPCFTWHAPHECMISKQLPQVCRRLI